jgi:hypothetical protein
MKIRLIASVGINNMETFFYLVGYVIGGAVTLIALIFAVRKLYGWLFPLIITPSIKVDGRELGLDQICVDVVNRSREPVYIIKCRARSVNETKRALKDHLKHPFTHPRNLQSIYYGFNSFEMMKEDKIKLEAGELKKIYRNMTFKNELFYVSTDFLVIELVISSGKIVRSRRFKIPEHWTVRSYFLSKQKYRNN